MQRICTSHEPTIITLRTVFGYMTCSSEYYFEWISFRNERPSREADNRRAGQDKPSPLWNVELLHNVHTRPPPGLEVLRSHLHILGLASGLFSWGLLTTVFTAVFISHACYLFRNFFLCVFFLAILSPPSSLSIHSNVACVRFGLVTSMQVKVKVLPEWDLKL